MTNRLVVGLFLLFGIVAPCLMPLQRVIAQTDSGGAFLTYTNVNYGFTMKYPPNWTVHDTTMSNYTGERGVKFTTPDGSGFLLVSISNQTNETGRSVEDAAKGFIAHPLTGAKLLEFNANTYFLSGHPAIRALAMASFGGPGEPGASQGIVPHDMKMMVLETYLGGKVYRVTYGSLPESYSTNLQTAQEMIDSFQIIRGGG